VSATVGEEITLHVTPSSKGAHPTLDQALSKSKTCSLNTKPTDPISVRPCNFYLVVADSLFLNFSNSAALRQEKRESGTLKQPCLTMGVMMTTLALQHPVTTTTEIVLANEVALDLLPVDVVA
jgi:hypothetical protein